MMKHSDFYLHMIFFTATGAWQVTDLGQRTVIAVRMDDVPDGVLTGPPYCVEEVVFSEDDFGGCRMKMIDD